MERKRLGFWAIWNMNFGFLGIQFGWALQMANMSAIYRFLGADPDRIAILWLAAPLTGLLVQPIIGHLSDRTWGPLGRRRPYFLGGAILSTIALVLMPNATSLFMAACLLWVLDASINISMEPFRAFVADLLPEQQRTRGFAMQSFFIGLGAIVASALPQILAKLHLVSDAAGPGIPAAIRISFYIGAVAFFTAVVWTVLTTKEYPPEKREETEGLAAGAREILRSIAEMPATMRQLARVQIFTWLGLFCMWLYFSGAVAHSVFGVDDPKSPQYVHAVEWAGVCFAFYSLVTFLFSPLLPQIAGRLGRRLTHALCLLAGAAGLASVAWIHSPHLLLLSMTGVGIAWASILAMPYAILSGSLPEGKMGVYMGIFNFFIVIPEIIASLGFGWVMAHLLHHDSTAAVVAGSVALVLAAGLMAGVQDVGEAEQAAGEGLAA